MHEQCLRDLKQALPQQGKSFARKSGSLTFNCSSVHVSNVVDLQHREMPVRQELCSHHANIMLSYGKTFEALTALCRHP